MAKQCSVNVGSAWKNVERISVNVGAAWKEVKQAFVNVGGTWREFWSAITVQLTNRNYNRASGVASVHVGYQLKTTGDQYYSESTTSPSWTDSTFDWLLAGSASDYDARMTITGASGSGGSGETFNISGTTASGDWVQLNADRQWGYGVAAGIKGCTATLEICPHGVPGTILASCTVDLYAEKTL